MDSRNFYVVLMAGGSGTRFWPLSTDHYPKQFHDLLGLGLSMLQTTFKRYCKFLPKEHIYISTREEYKEHIKLQFPDIDSQQIICEPALRNTAPSILYSIFKINDINPKAVVVVSPSDAWISDDEIYKEDMLKALSYCSENEDIITFGLRIKFPSTAYGYIEYSKAQTHPYPVISFKEKPNKKQAQHYIDKATYLWNSGVFVWKTALILELYKKHQPNMYHTLDFKGYNSDVEKEKIKRLYPQCKNISIDYAIIEQAKNIKVFPASFEWNDLGSWNALYNQLKQHNEENVSIKTKTIIQNGKGNIVHSYSGKNVILDGLTDYIVVETKDNLLIYPKSKDQEIKQIKERAEKL